MTVLLLTACGSGAAVEEQIEAKRDALAEAQKIAFTADVTADLGDEAFGCALSCVSTPEAVTMEVLSPELVAGVKATLAAGEATLQYGGVQLSFGAETFGPFAALPLLCKGLRSGHVVRAWTEDDLLAAEFYADDDHSLTVRFDAETLTPRHAELSERGAVVVKCEIKDFICE